jgi:hypothetical protein
MSEERRNRRQIDRIEEKIDKLCRWMNGENEMIGAKDKLNILWNYRYLFVGCVMSMISGIIVYFARIWNH